MKTITKFLLSFMLLAVSLMAGYVPAEATKHPPNKMEYSVIIVEEVSAPEQSAYLFASNSIPGLPAEKETVIIENTRELTPELIKTYAPQTEKPADVRWLFPQKANTYVKNRSGYANSKLLGRSLRPYFNKTC